MACRKFNDCSSCEHGMPENDGCYLFTGLHPFCEYFSCIHAETCDRECISFEEQYWIIRGE